MAKTTVTIRVNIEGVREALRAFTELPKDASQRLRDESLKLAESLAVKAKAEGVAEGAQAALVARTVKAVRDRVPVIQVGGTTRLGRYRAPAYGLLFGSMFGMNARSGWYADSRYAKSTGRQYKEHRGQNAYWFFPVVERNQREISEAWNRVADGIVRDFSQGGDI